MKQRTRHDDGKTDIGIFGDLTDNEGDILGGILDLEDGARCRVFINSCGGSPYTAMGIIALLTRKRLKLTAVALGECMSAAAMIFAAARKRYATPHTVFLFHPMRWQSQEAASAEAVSWANEFKRLERDLDEVMADYLGMEVKELRVWNRKHRYITGVELAERGLCELYDLGPLAKPR